MKPEEAAAAVEEDPNSPSEILKLVPEELLETHLIDRHTKNLTDLIELVMDGGRDRMRLCKRWENCTCATTRRSWKPKRTSTRWWGGSTVRGDSGTTTAPVCWAASPHQRHAKQRADRWRRKNHGPMQHGGGIHGVTLRIGRYFPGSASAIDDLLFHVQDGPDKAERAPSILIVEKPGSDKTTVLRDICRKVSEEQTVVIVDTSNEIAGDGDIPHPRAIGQSRRRMMVPHKDGQHSVMKEALQNHTPQMVDEVSNKPEARACLESRLPP
eukprot:g16124.t1